MSETMIEIRWHGRGGQGAKTASLLFAEMAMSTGMYVQAFPEYGPERMGAPVQSFNRISENPILIHSGIKNPDYVVVLDFSLLNSVSVTSGMNEGSKIIVNTFLNAHEIAEKLNINKSQVYVINASKIAIDTIGKDIPNTPMLGALIKVIDTLDINSVLESVRNKLINKFRHKPEIIDGNIMSIKTAFNEVKN
ncbi:MAG: 2-oxoacid:acceptor oxidoreductase family protein [Endomicrobium sp.]|jgi:pyruvate ferredoxin oxidoreductase gamma subunit|nr:2-oxoacid:acceptor oxidoreductase family protein [Endomicrobium sp.]